MKYIAYILSIPTILFLKIFGIFWTILILPFRAWARNTVHNYTLRNNIACKRLMERKPKLVGNKWILSNIHNVNKKGYILYDKVSWLEYQLALWLVWGWLDDDANEDTFAKGHSEEYISGKRKWPILNDWLVKRLKKEVLNTTYGNTFDLGDNRANYPNFGLFSFIIWNTRNTTQNFAYLLSVTADTNKIFKWKIGSYVFGWEKDGKPVNGVQYYIRRIGKNF